MSWSVPIAHPAGVHDAARAPRFEGAVINATTARRLLANDDAMLYDNPQALLLCHYKREQALCHRTGMRETPRLDHCVPRCGNIVRTDHHATTLRHRADTLDNRPRTCHSRSAKGHVTTPTGCAAPPTLTTAPGSL